MSDIEIIGFLGLGFLSLFGLFIGLWMLHDD